MWTTMPFKLLINMTAFQLDSRYGFMFNSNQGFLKSYDLWQIPFSTTKSNKASLDDVYANLMEEKAKQTTHSLTQRSQDNSSYIDERIEIVKFIFETRQAENKAEAQRKENAELKQLLLSKAREKQVESLLEGSPEELIARASQL